MCVCGVDAVSMRGLVFRGGPMHSFSCGSSRMGWVVIEVEKGSGCGRAKEEHHRRASTSRIAVIVSGCLERDSGPVSHHSGRRRFEALCECRTRGGGNVE